MQILIYGIDFRRWRVLLPEYKSAKQTAINTHVDLVALVSGRSCAAVCKMFPEREETVIVSLGRWMALNGLSPMFHK